MRPAVLAQHHLRLILQVLHLLGVLQTPGLCKQPNVSETESGLTSQTKIDSLLQVSGTMTVKE